MRFTPPPRGPVLSGIDTRSLDQGLANVGNALAQRRQEQENQRRYDEQIAMRKENALASRHMQNQRLKLAQQKATQGQVMNVGGRLVRVAPGADPQVVYTPPKPPVDPMDQKLKEARLKKLQEGDPLKEIKARVLQRLLAPGQQQAPAQAEPRVQLQSGEVTTTDPNLIQAQTAEQAPEAPQQPDALSNLTPEQRQAMALDLVSPGLGNAIRQGQKSEQFGKPAVNKIETKIIDAEEGYARLQSIQQQFKREYQTFLGQGKGAWFELKDRFGQLSADEESYLREFSQFRQTTAQNLNLYIKEITGAQMSEAEAKRLSQGVPVAGNGVFDGDSPTRFQAKMNQTLRDIALARMRYHFMRSGGWNGTQMSPEDIAKSLRGRNVPIALPKMRSIFNNRVKQLQKSGVERSQAIGQAKQEFGI